MPKATLFLIFAILSEVAGTTALKFTDGFTKLVPSVITVVGYCLAFYLLSLSLKSMSIGFAYAVWAGVGIVLIALIGVIFLGEKADLNGAIGIGLIVAGVVILNNFSKMGGH
ncbi:DMT family transporter [Aestuariispira insulae]|uniref:Small multidrug resistance pump n=1 Tax=Aestuariispira insulae TaxID=1461337 RepID=A0A3D9HNJ9_9PROT|nr:SMR family transporter [Aestuariispira insulae]RED51052.1 small multidrug resistance pump [Aestuariispira insulae]